MEKQNNHEKAITIRFCQADYIKLKEIADKEDVKISKVIREGIADTLQEIFSEVEPSKELRNKYLVKQFVESMTKKDEHSKGDRKISVRIDQDDFDKLKEFSDKVGVPVSVVIRDSTANIVNKKTIEHAQQKSLEGSTSTEELKNEITVQRYIIQKLVKDNEKMHAQIQKMQNEIAELHQSLGRKL